MFRYVNKLLEQTIHNSSFSQRYKVAIFRIVEYVKFKVCKGCVRTAVHLNWRTAINELGVHV